LVLINPTRSENTMIDEKLVITESGFLTEFFNQHSQRPDRPFCFIFGAGVSKPSGILTGGEMATIWLREIHESENFDGLTVEDWATPERLGIPGFAIDRLAQFYPQLYRRRYGNYEEAGYAFLESQMEGKEPSFGYSVLAYILSETPHRAVVTTNFDNLVTDALSIHSGRFPLVVGHDSLAQYAAVELRRPLIAKIHGALGFAPKNQPDEITDLPEGWCIALRRILERYTPIVMGYEGNDGSLMSFLQSLPEHIPDRVLWCVYAPEAKPRDCLDHVSPVVRDYVRTRRGRFIPIRGFDELMAKLLRKLREKGSVPDLYERLKERARQRERNYDEQQRKLFEASENNGQPDEGGVTHLPHPTHDALISEAASAIAESRKDKPWWVWSKEAFMAPDADTKEAIYLRALEALPESSNMARSYALFLEQDRKDMEKAEKLYQRSIEMEPNGSLSLAFYADFLHKFKKDSAKTEEYYQRSIEADPKNEFALTQYASFLETVRKDMKRAEEYHQRAVSVDQPSAYGLRKYASFLETVRKDMDSAEKYYVLAVEAEPKKAYNLRCYARFLRSARGNTAKADELEQRAQSINTPDSAT